MNISSDFLNDALTIEPWFTRNWSYFMQTETFKWKRGIKVSHAPQQIARNYTEFEQLKFRKKKFGIKWKRNQSWFWLNEITLKWIGVYHLGRVVIFGVSCTNERCLIRKKQTSFKINTFLLKYNVLWSQSTTWSVMIEIDLIAFQPL